MTQSILTSLLEVQQSMPPEYAVELRSEPQSFSRTGATLYLMLFQAIMLVTRPILLHTARTHLKKDYTREDAPAADSALLLKFSNVCVDAAKHTLTIVESVKTQGILGKLI